MIDKNMGGVKTDESNKKEKNTSLRAYVVQRLSAAKDHGGKGGKKERIGKNWNALWH